MRYRIKAQSTTLLPPLPTTPPSAPSPSKQQSPVKQPKRQRAKKEKLVVNKVIDPPEIQTISRQRSRRRLFHDEVIARALAN
jgi:hypothetical protein